MVPEVILVGLWVLLIMYLVMQIRYTIDDEYVRVIWIGRTVRKISLHDIEDVDTHCPLWNEHWCNTFFPSGRLVRIRRKSGLFRNFVISPRDRDDFIRQLRRRVGLSE